MWRRGFLSELFTVYQLKSPGAATSYFSDVQRHAGIWGINQPFEHILDNKLTFWAFLKNFSKDIAPVLGLIQNNVLYSFVNLDDGTINIGLNDLNRLGNKLILKPLSASGGLGIALYEWRDNTHYLNGKYCTVAELSSAVANSQYIVCTFIEQAAYAAMIFHDTANTLRIFDALR